MQPFELSKPRTDIDVLVLMGGTSDERAISLKSGAAAFKALQQAGFQVRSHDPSCLQELLVVLETEPPNCVFNALHGGYGEDGHIPAILDMLRIPYTHSGVRASAIAMDKPLTRTLALTVGCKVAEADITNWETLKKVGLSKCRVTPPCVIKPADNGSTLGCVFVSSEDDHDFATQLPSRRPAKERVLIEEYVPGLEITVSVLNGQALVCTEISFPGPIFNYVSKYESEAVRHLPARIPKEIEELAQRQAEAVHNAIGCTGLTRCDFRWDDNIAGTNGLVFIELNSHPGLTTGSLAPEQAAHVGISFSELCATLVASALVHSNSAHQETNS